MSFRSNLSAVLILTLLCGASAPVMAQAVQDESAAPVDFTADSLSNDEATKTVTATGNVELAQNGRILKADKVVYSVATDTVKATGNVVLMEANGDVHFADEVEVTDQMRDGYVKHLRSTLIDGSRFWAEEGQREGETTTTMTNAGYTPCEPCKTHPESPPVWAIEASEVRHEEDNQRVVYKDATFELWGTPVAWLPYFTHADGTVKQKSGFLTPSFGFKSDLGFMVGNSYYMALDPSYDATVGLTAFTDQAPLLTGEYRQRFDNAQLIVNGGVTYSSRTDLEADVDVEQDEEIRGHLFADGLWDINDQWRAGLGVEFASDDQYMRQYDFSSKDVLENQLYLERFSGRNYAIGRVLAFQDIRVVDERTDQPDVLPEINAGFLGDPGQTLGGRWSFDISALGLRREAGGQDVGRVVTEAGWQRRLISDTGLVANIDLSARADAYTTRDRDVALAGSGRSSDGEQARGFAQAHMVASYPVVKQMERAQIVIEPEIALTAAPNIQNKSGSIPNEDSQDAQIDASNVFDANRFPGLDRIEDESRVTYGVRTGIHGAEGSKGEIFIGQSHRFKDGPTPFPEGSGLTDQDSDVVGQITANYKNRFTIDYRFQLDNVDMSPRRHEVSAMAQAGPVTLTSQYLYANPIEGTNLDDDREQIQAGIGYQVTDEWRVRTAVLRDLGEDEGLRRATLGVDYLGQCFTVAATVDRNLTRDSSGESNTEVFFRVGLKNLGEFETSGISLGGSSSEDDDDESQALALPP